MDRFIVSPFIMSVDGPDGIGKSLFTELLVKEIKSFNRNEVILVRPTYFTSSNKAKKLGANLKKKNFGKESKNHNSYFLKAMRANYKEVIIPAIRKKTIVILDSSEIRSLAFMLDRGSKEAVDDTIKKIENGFVNFGIQPKYRIILRMNRQSIFQNLLSKRDFDSGDPKSIKDVYQRVNSYNCAICTILKNTKVSYWKFLRVNRVEKSFVEDYLLDIIRKNILPLIFQ